MSNFAIKRRLREIYKKHFLSSSQQMKSTKTSSSVFAESFGEDGNSEFKLQFMKISECFLDSYGNTTSTLKTFRTKYF